MKKNPKKLPQISIKTELKTRRLILRPYRVSDYKNWSESRKSQHLSQNEYDPGVPSEKNLTKEFFQKYVAKKKSNWMKDSQYVFGIFLKKTGENIGTSDFFIYDRMSIQSANFGYHIYNHHWRQGYAFESSKALIHFAFKELGLHRLEAGIERGNQASIKLIKKLDFKYECFRENFLYYNQKWLGLEYFSLTPEMIGHKAKKPFVWRSLL